MELRFLGEAEKSGINGSSRGRFESKTSRVVIGMGSKGGIELT